RERTAESEAIFHDRREVIERIHDGLPLGAENGLGFGRTLPVGAYSGYTRPRVPLISQIPAGHILPNEHALPVAVVIPAGRLHLDVLADHIEAHFLGLLNIKKKRLVGGRGI